jgi:hypothetical protein
MFEEEYDRFVTTGDLIFGNGIYSSLDILYGSSSYKSIVYDVGIFGVLIFVIFHGYYFVSAYKYSDKYLLTVFILFFFLSLYQRPYLIEPGMLVIFIVG